MKTKQSVPPVVRQVLAAIRRQDWDGVKPLLHPYLHWTGRDGRVIRGRTNVLAYLGSTPATGLPRQHEIRDDQIYRWVESEDLPPLRQGRLVRKIGPFRCEMSQ